MSSIDILINPQQPPGSSLQPFF